MPSLQTQIAQSFGAPPALTDLLPQLFANTSLGANPTQILQLLRRAKLKPSSELLELACGHGQVAVAIASKLFTRGHITGIDAHPALITAARHLAAKHNVQHRCSFFTSDINRYRRARVTTRFDAAIMLNLLDAPSAAQLLRRWVKPKGLYIIDDAPRSNSAPRSFHSAPTLEDTRTAIESHGDRIEHELILTPATIRQQTTRILKAQAKATEQLAAENPKLRTTLHRYLTQARRNSEPLGTHFRPTIWLVRRAASR